MKIDIKDVLSEIKITTDLVNNIDTGDVKPSDMKAMTNVKKYTDGILEYIKLNPSIDSAVLKEIIQSLDDYSKSLNLK